MLHPVRHACMSLLSMLLIVTAIFDPRPASIEGEGDTGQFSISVTWPHASAERVADAVEQLSIVCRDLSCCHEHAPVEPPARLVAG